MESIVLLGGGGHASSIADSIEMCGQYFIVGYTDSVKGISYIPYIGMDDVLEDLFKSGVHCAAICVGYLGKSDIRDSLYQKIKSIGFKLPAIIDPTAIISPRCSIGEGTFVGKGVCINVGSIIGKMCIINTHATIEHDNFIGDFSHIAVGATLCGNVSVSNHVLIGANATIIQGCSIGSNSIIGASSVVLHDVQENKTVYGIV